jgi:hypothetical protein
LTSEPKVVIRFDRGAGTYYPGETLSGEYLVDGVSPDEVKAVEVSILWHTEGKGDEDLAVHHFERFSPEEGSLHAPTFGEFHTVLPNSPLSYEGVTIKVRWCVRVRVFVRRGKEAIGEAPFKLDDIPAVEAAQS